MQTGNTVKLQPESSGEKKKKQKQKEKLMVLIVKSTWLRKMSPTLLTSGLAQYGNSLDDQSSEYWMSCGLDT